MSILIKINPEIIGITVGENEYKFLQFANDTILILDGNQSFIHATPNTLLILGSLSGLKVDTDIVIWIGKKRFSKDK